MSEKRGPPPLPPRAPSIQLRVSPCLNVEHEPGHEDVPADAPPSYQSVVAESVSDDNNYAALAGKDPRSASTQSLLPAEGHENDHRRTLLLIYIHGFMGNETSFQSFPAHVHNLVAVLISETHVVHTKIYPRYRSKKRITFARDDFSRWLAPHEDHATDVIFLGHSMGGLLSAEVALVTEGNHLRHRVLGTINFDVPFLGMSPSVIKSGLASIFSPAAAESPAPPAPNATPAPGAAATEPGDYLTQGRPQAPPPLPPRRPTNLSSNSSDDPNYDPAFPNDVRLPVRTGWGNLWHFVNKHQDDLIAATKQLVKSHMEFGGAMANYSELKSRYSRIRVLEEENPDVRKSMMTITPPRVRFVNYYTASTGRPRRVKTPSPAATPDVQAGSSSNDAPYNTSSSLERNDTNASGSVIPTTNAAHLLDNVNSEPHDDGSSVDDKETVVDEVDTDVEGDKGVHALDMDQLDPLPMSDDAGDTSDSEPWADAMEDLDPSRANGDHAEAPESGSTTMQAPESNASPGPAASFTDSTISLTQSVSLPPLPELPQKPAEPAYPAYLDKDTRKLIEKDYKRATKAYEQAVKDREKATRDRAKLLEKQERKQERRAAKDGKKAERRIVKDARDGTRNAEREERNVRSDLERSEKDRDRAARKAAAAQQKARDDAEDNILKVQRRATEKEWEEALRMKWNDEDSTVSPMPSSIASPSQSTLTTTRSGSTLAASVSAVKEKEKKEKPLKEHNFCSLPPRDSHGNRDPTWVKIFMKDVDEVGAHCGLFFETSPAYETLIGDVGERILDWVSLAEGERVALEVSVD